MPFILSDFVFIARTIFIYFFIDFLHAFPYTIPKFNNHHQQKGYTMPFIKGHKSCRKPATINSNASKHIDFTSEQTQELKTISRHTPSVLKTFQHAFIRKSRNAAVKAKCIECSNFQKPEVAKCSISGCPLWRYRPYQPK